MAETASENGSLAYSCAAASSCPDASGSSRATFLARSTAAMRRPVTRSNSASVSHFPRPAPASDSASALKNNSPWISPTHAA